MFPRRACLYLSAHDKDSGSKTDIYNRNAPRAGLGEGEGGGGRGGKGRALFPLKFLPTNMVKLRCEASISTVHGSLPDTWLYQYTDFDLGSGCGSYRYLCRRRRESRGCHTGSTKCARIASF